MTGWALLRRSWFPARGREAASRYRGEDVGVHLTLTAEFELYRWGPCTRSPSLFGGDGGFASSVADAWDHADLDEVRRELRAQVERAILWGFDVTHLDSHMGGPPAAPGVLRRVHGPGGGLRAPDPALGRLDPGGRRVPVP
ncbi:MAG: ChbG/HpnK family deacetylase [Microthrixaceae bacterium]|nr:ChbG/HpnK family deacetylase [Microthrixaceae bacterium]